MLPCGIFSRNYRDELRVFRTRSSLGLFVGFLIMVALIPLFATYYWLTLINFLLIFIVNTLGMNILLGYAGQVNLGHAAFMGMGAYTSAILTGEAGLPFLVSLPLAGLVSGGFGVVFGFPSLRVKGFYLALVTLGAQFILVYIFEHLKITGGTDGMKCPFASIGPLVFDTAAKICWLVMAVTAIMIFAAYNIPRSRLGRALIGIRDNEVAAEVLGINVLHYKLVAFFLGCFYAGIAGSLWSHFLTSVHPDQFPFFDSILYIGSIIVGGIGSLGGAISGAIVIRGLDEVTRIGLVPMIVDWFPGLGPNVIQSFAPMVYGIVIIVFLVLQPKGLLDLWERVRNFMERWPFSLK
jgi:branched-chain amino acid transport system permease protein